VRGETCPDKPISRKVHDKRKEEKVEKSSKGGGYKSGQVLRGKAKMFRGGRGNQTPKGSGNERSILPKRRKAKKK